MPKLESLTINNKTVELDDIVLITFKLKDNKKGKLIRICKTSIHLEELNDDESDYIKNIYQMKHITNIEELTRREHKLKRDRDYEDWFNKIETERNEKQKRYETDLKDRVKRFVRDDYEELRRKYEDIFINELEDLKKSGSKKFINEMIDLINDNFDEMEISNILRTYLKNNFLNL